MNDKNTDVLVYHFDKTEMFLLGKDKARLDPKTQCPLVPANATLVPPPNEWHDDCIPVFNGKSWTIEKDIFWRPRSIEINYDAGRPSTTWAPKVISLAQFHTYPNLERLTNSNHVVLRIIDSIRYIDKKFLDIIQIFKSLKVQDLSIIDDVKWDVNLRAKPTIYGVYKFECESLIFQIRHCLDAFVRLTELLVDANRVNQKKCFQCDNVGSLFQKNEPKTGRVSNIVLGLSVELEGDDTNFLSITNRLFNAMKHTHMNAETQILHGVEYPTITACWVRDGRHDDTIEFHNHNAYQLMIGFHDTIDRILGNQYFFIQNGRT